jgi:Ras-related protein Rab-18
MSDDEEGSGMIKCKITLIGESTVGKTSIIKQYISNIFNRDILSTIGGEREYKSIVINGKKVRLVFWDTAGQEKFRSLSRIFLNKSNIVVFVYDITKRDTFEKLKEIWYPTAIQILGKENVVYGVAANKSDLYENEEVKYEEGEAFAKSINAIIKETTAMNHKQIEELITDLVKSFLDRGLDEIDQTDTTSKLEVAKAVKKPKDKNSKCC